MSEFVPQNGEMFTVTMFDAGIDRDNETIIFVSDSRKLANEVVDELNELAVDDRFNLHLNQIQSDWIRQFLFSMGYKDTISTDFGNPFFSYDPVKFATYVEQETEEERQEREAAEQQEETEQ